MIIGYSRTFGYRANAVTFDGTNDFLTRGADLTGISDGQAGTASFWVNFNGGDGSTQMVLTADAAGANFQIHRSALGDVWRLFGATAGETVILDVLGSTAFTVSSGWHHVLLAWNLATPEAHMWINDANGEAVGATEINGIIDYTEGNFGVGGRTDGALLLNADVADLWFDDSFVDITLEANRRKFISGTGKPVDLELDGSGPTGSSPIIFLSGATAAWHTNKGTGGGFTKNGALTDASTSPSD